MNIDSSSALKRSQSARTPLKKTEQGTSSYHASSIFHASPTYFRDAGTTEKEHPEITNINSDATVSFTTRNARIVHNTASKHSEERNDVIELNQSNLDEEHNSCGTSIQREGIPVIPTHPTSSVTHPSVAPAPGSKNDYDAPKAANNDTHSSVVSNDVNILNDNQPALHHWSEIDAVLVHVPRRRLQIVTPTRRSQRLLESHIRFALEDETERMQRELGE